MITGGAIQHTLNCFLSKHFVDCTWGSTNVGSQIRWNTFSLIHSNNNHDRGC